MERLLGSDFNEIAALYTMCSPWPDPLSMLRDHDANCVRHLKQTNACKFAASSVPEIKILLIVV